MSYLRKVGFRVNSSLVTLRRIYGKVRVFRLIPDGPLFVVRAERVGLLPYSFRLITSGSPFLALTEKVRFSFGELLGHSEKVLDIWGGLGTFGEVFFRKKCNLQSSIKW